MPSESTMGARCSRSAYTPLLRCLCSYACGVKPGSTEALRLISEIFLLLQCAAARALEQADHALAQVRPRQIFTCTLSKNGRILVAV